MKRLSRKKSTMSIAPPEEEPKENKLRKASAKATGNSSGGGQPKISSFFSKRPFAAIKEGILNRSLTQQPDEGSQRLSSKQPQRKSPERTALRSKFSSEVAGQNTGQKSPSPVPECVVEDPSGEEGPHLKRPRFGSDDEYPLTSLNGPEELEFEFESSVVEEGHSCHKETKALQPLAFVDFAASVEDEPECGTEDKDLEVPPKKKSESDAEGKNRNEATLEKADSSEAEREVRQEASCDGRSNKETPPCDQHQCCGTGGRINLAEPAQSNIDGEGHLSHKDASEDVQNSTEDDLFDGSDADFVEFEFDAIENKSKEVAQRPKPLTDAYGRHRVIQVDKLCFNTTVLHLVPDIDDKGVNRLVVNLEGSWATTEVYVGDVVNVLDLETGTTVSSNGAGRPVVVNDNGPLVVVVNPDLLISGTSIVSTLFCMRKAVLNERYRGLEGGSRVMLIGTLVHELLQECLKNRRRGSQEIRAQLDAVLTSPSILKDAISLNLTEDMIRFEVEPFLPHIEFFIQRYVLGQVSLTEAPAAAYANIPGSKGGSQRSFGGRAPPAAQMWEGLIQDVMDIEESIWSPRLGMKGKVDLTVRVKLRKADKKNRSEKVMPLELKTGRPSGSAEHKGQVILYNMLMSERRPDPDTGLLLYLRTSSMSEVASGINEMRGLVQMRNRLAAGLVAGDGHLPDPINLRRACEQCALLPACALHFDLEGDPDASRSKNKVMAEELVPSAVAFLTPEDKAFFQEQSRLCSLEDGEVRRSGRLKTLWCQSPQSREASGMAIADLVLAGQKTAEAGHQSYGFQRKSPGQRAIPEVFYPGCPVIISTDVDLAFGLGTVEAATPELLQVRVDRDLSSYGKNGQGTPYHVDRYPGKSSSSSSSSSYLSTSSASATSAGRVNLVRLMSPDPSCTKLRRIVVNGEETAFRAGLERKVALEAKPFLKSLNVAQQKAVFRILMAESYCLLDGMPGCGKTTVIVALVRLLARLGRSVLLASFTNAAVDNILLKLKQSLEADKDNHTLKVLRIASTSGGDAKNPGRVHPEVWEAFSEQALLRAKLPGGQGDIKMTSKDLKTLYDEAQVVACTCLGAGGGHPGVATRRFDYCILDEAGQAPLLASLGPLLRCDKFVLVGDPRQLPPVVQSSEARKQGMDVSLFVRLGGQQGQPSNKSVIPLGLQYRMNSQIEALANHLTYGGKLEAGCPQVATRRVGRRLRKTTTDDQEWKRRFSDPDNVANSVLFMDTSRLVPEAEQVTSKQAGCNIRGLHNPFEAELVRELCLLAHGFDVQKTADGDGVCEDLVVPVGTMSVGVIAPYRAQVDCLKDVLKKEPRHGPAGGTRAGSPGSSGVDHWAEVSTVDQFQGKDKDVVILSCVRTKPLGSLSLTKNSNSMKELDEEDILCDRRRLNVAITRAKSKLVLVGNASALKTYPPFADLLSYCEDQGLVVHLEK